MGEKRSRLSTRIDFDRDGKQCDYLQLPHSVHRSAYGWLPVPLVCIKNGTGADGAARFGACMATNMRGR